MHLTLLSLQLRYLCNSLCGCYWPASDTSLVKDTDMQSSAVVELAEIHNVPMSVHDFSVVSFCKDPKIKQANSVRFTYIPELYYNITTCEPEIQKLQDDNQTLTSQSIKCALQAERQLNIQWGTACVHLAAVEEQHCTAAVSRGKCLVIISTETRKWFSV